MDNTSNPIPGQDGPPPVPPNQAPPIAQSGPPPVPPQRRPPPPRAYPSPQKAEAGSVLAGKRLFWAILALGSLIMALIYLFMFNSLSETAMVQLSFFWISLLGFGLGGLLGVNEGIGKGLLYGFVSAFVLMLGLQAFFVVIWPSL